LARLSLPESKEKRDSRLKCSSDNLTPAQKKAVNHLEGPLLVLAGPGSGKTRVITHRIAALIDAGVRPYNICAVTFTNRVADEMRQRVITFGAAAGAHISTFHSLCVRILRRYAEQAGLRENFSIYNEADQKSCMKQALKDCEIDSTNFPPARMLDAVSLLKNALKDVDFIKSNVDDFFTKIIARLYARYQEILAANNALDFDDLLLKAAFLLRDRLDVRSELNRRFKFLLVDEYQDTNKAQYEIARELVSEHGNICVTGDPDQSIYRWRGADIGNILAFEKDWPDAAVIRLEQNFRSSPNILAVADKLISFNVRRKAKVLIPTKPPGQEVVFESCDDENDEAFSVVGRIAKLAENGAKLNEIAVFYRVNAMSRVLEEAFIESKIPYQIVRGIEFYNRKEIRDLIAYLKVLVNPDDEVALLRIINTPSRGIGKTTIQRVSAYAAIHKISFYEALCRAEKIESLGRPARTKLADFAKMMEEFRKDVNDPEIKVAELMERVYLASGMAAELRAGTSEQGTAADNVNELISSATHYDSVSEDGSLLDYLQQIALFSDSDAYDATRGSVALMTLHSAKGLEFENVFIIGLEEGILPHARSSDNDEELEEERRLFFVGITRAKAGLYISYAKHRLLRGQLTRGIPSQFLYDIEAGSVLYESKETNDYEEDSQINQAQAGFTPGDLVKHEIFGFGRIKEFVDMGENSVVVIKFDTGQIKTLMLKYADLSRI
jgi:DNA helicase-2/ATP-dependent DNA helicase PcrA